MMPAWSDAVLLLSRSAELSLLTKATVILVAALLATRVAKRAKASARHLVIASTFAALLALPALIVLVPNLTIDVPVARIADAQRVVSTPDSAARPFGVRVPAPAASTMRFSLADSLRFVWLLGAIVFVVPVAAVLWRLSVIRRTGLPVARFGAELRRLLIERGIASQVELIEHEGVPAPMTFGLRSSVIVLPLDAREWSEADLRRALMHELEHIQRGDWLIQVMARVIAACYWFHPLVWTAWRRLCLEAERSCDDAVVISEEGTDYAEQLVTLAQRMSARPVQPLLGMANRSDLSTRVSAVLDDRLHRGRAGFTLAAGTIAAAAVMVVTVAPMRAVAVVTAADTAVSAADQSRSSKRAPGQRKARALDRELYEAAQAGDLEGVKEMLDAGANANAVIDGDGSPLIGAARSGRLDIAKLLLDQGADPNQIVEGDGSPLIAAAAHGRFDQVELLIQRGGDVNLAVKGDENPLMNAAEHGHLKIVKLLVDKGADIHARIFSGRSPSGGEWRTAVSQARKNGHMTVVKYLQDLGVR
jgi:beta-lactamase regulating signal transducer with metallopeptidase domain